MLDPAIAFLNGGHAGNLNQENSQGISLYTMKKWDKAAEVFDPAQESNDSAKVLVSYCHLYCLARLERVDESIAAAKALSELTKNDTWDYLVEHKFSRFTRSFALQYLAYQAGAREDYEAAEQYAQESIAVKGSTDEWSLTGARETQVRIFLAQEKMDEAYMAILELLEKDPQNQTFATEMATDGYKSYAADNDITSLKTGPEGETAAEALDRYDKFCRIKGYEGVNYTDKVTAEELDAAEEKLGLALPPSYREFLLDRGCFALGECCSALFEPKKLCRLPDEDEDVAMVEDWDEDDQKSANELICFSYGDAQLQIVWYYCFDLRTRNPETGEMDVYGWDHHLSEIYDAGGICVGSGFDAHVSAVVDEEIEEMLHD